MTGAPYFDRDGITIYHGDCRDVLPGLDPLSVDLVLTDPPYGISLRTNYSEIGRSSESDYITNYQGRSYAPVFDDDKPFDPAPLLRFSRLILFGANHYADKLPPSASWIVWDKLDGLTSKRDWGFNDNADAELIWTNIGGPVRLIGHRWTGLLRASEAQERRVHPTQKPVALMRFLLERFSKPGDLILDPYMGSGPIPQACHEMGRRCIAFEIVRDYCDVAVKRLAQSVLPLTA